MKNFTPNRVKKESDTTFYSACTKRGNKNQKCIGKARYIKAIGIVNLLQKNSKKYILKRTLKI